MVGKIRDVNSKPKKQVWFTSEVREMRREVKKLFRRAKRRMGCKKKGFVKILLLVCEW